MIREFQNVFHLQTEHYSYLLRINPFQLPEHLYFGAPVRDEDAEGFLLTPGLGWGSSVVLDDQDPGSSPDVFSLEWSGSGRGDYRESPLELAGASSDFRFRSYRIWEGSVPMTCGLPQAHDALDTLELILEQRGLRLYLYYTLFPTALVRLTVLENVGEEAVLLQKYIY